MIGMTRMTGMNVVIRMTGMTKEPGKTWNNGMDTSWCSGK